MSKPDLFLTKQSTNSLNLIKILMKLN